MLLMLWMASPLALRYATEARPYSQAIFFSVSATLLLVRLVRTPSWSLALLYLLALVAGLYSAPYTLFPQIGYLVALVIGRVPIRTTLLAIVCLTVAVLSLAPWALWARAGWHQAVDSRQWALHVNLKFALMILQEISGGGYFCSIALFILAAVGFWSSGVSRFVKGFLACGIASTIILRSRGGYGIPLLLCGTSALVHSDSTHIAGRRGDPLAAETKDIGGDRYLGHILRGCTRQEHQLFQRSVGGLGSRCAGNPSQA